MIEFGIVAPEFLHEAWERCLPLLREAHEHNGNLDSPVDTYRLLIENKKYLWLALKEGKVIGLVLTSIENYPCKKVCSIDVCTGDNLDEWIDNLPLVEQWAKENGCKEMFFMARAGYERKLKEFEYRKTHIFLQKALA